MSIRRLAIAVAIVLCALAVSTSTAGAAAPGHWKCSGKPVTFNSGSLLDPVTLALDQGLLSAFDAVTDPCAGNAGGPLSNFALPVILTAHTVYAHTAADTTKAPSLQHPHADAGVENLKVDLGAPGVPPDLIQIGAAESTADLTGCTGTTPTFAGTKNVANVRIAGQNVDLTDGVNQIVTGLNPLDPIVNIVVGEQTNVGGVFTETALHITVLQAGGTLLDLSIAQSQIGGVGTPCVPEAPGVGVPTVNGRTITSFITVPDGTTIASCGFTVTPTGGGAAQTVTGTYDATTHTCNGTLTRDKFPPGDYSATGNATTNAGGAATGNPGAFTLLPPTVGDATIVHRHVSTPVTPGSGAIVNLCTLKVTPAGGGDAVTVSGAYDFTDGTCEFDIPTDVPPGSYSAETTVTDSNGDSASKTTAVVVHGPTVGPPVLTNHTVTATVTPEAGTSITGCEFRVTPKGGTQTTVVKGEFKDGVCTATLPGDQFPAGIYTIVAAATDDAGNTSTHTGQGELKASTISTPTLTGRDVGANVTPPPGTTITNCTYTILAKGAAPVTLPATVSNPSGGTAIANLPSDKFPPGVYLVTLTCTDSGGGVSSSSALITVLGPAIGVPAITGGNTIQAIARPGSGATVTSCSMTLTPAKGGTAQTVAAPYDVATKLCSAQLSPSAFPSGTYRVVDTVVDSAGRSAKNSGRVTIKQKVSTVAASAALSCQRRRLVLLDTVIAQNNVRISGAAVASYVGRTVKILADGKVVGTTKVLSSQLFSARLALPRAAIRSSVRYAVAIGTSKSRTLKLERRMIVTSLVQHGSKITMTGVVRGALPSTPQVIVVKRRKTCTNYATVARGTMTKTGRFSITFSAPSNVDVALYRAQTLVPDQPGAPATKATFTLPRVIALT